MNLDEYFADGCMKIGMEKKREIIPYPGTVQDFLKWVGNTDQKAVEAMKFDELELLPAMKKYHIESVGAGRWHSNLKKWSFVIKEESTNLRRSEEFQSKPMLDYNNAFLSGLILIWEMITRRRMG